MNILLLIVAFIVLILINIRDVLMSNKIKKTLFFNMILIFLSFIISLLLVLDKAPQGPAYFIERLVKSVI